MTTAADRLRNAHDRLVALAYETERVRDAVRSDAASADPATLVSMLQQLGAVERECARIRAAVEAGAQS